MQYANISPASAPDIRFTSNDAIARWVGARLVIGFEGRHPFDPGVQHVRMLAERGKIGGLIFCSFNMQSTAQLQRLTQAIHRWRIPDHNRPLLLMTNEHAAVHEAVMPNALVNPSQLSIGAGTKLDLMPARAATGINIHTVVPLAAAGQPGVSARSHQTSMQQTAIAAVARKQAEIDALRLPGVAIGIRHFPGAYTIRPPQYDGAVARANSCEPATLELFGELFAQHNVQIVMTSHMISKQLDPSGVPATFSRQMVTHLLREQLGFDGVVMTDDLLTGAIQRKGQQAQTVYRAFEAGHDILCISNNEAALGPGRSSAHRPDDQLVERCIAAVRAAAASGILTPQMFADSDRRLDVLRRTMRSKPPMT